MHCFTIVNNNMQFRFSINFEQFFLTKVNFNSSQKTANITNAFKSIRTSFKSGKGVGSVLCNQMGCTSKDARIMQNNTGKGEGNMKISRVLLGHSSNIQSNDVIPHWLIYFLNNCLIFEWKQPSQIKILE